MSRVTIPAYASDHPEQAQTLLQAMLPFYCINCYRKRETTYLTPDFGPFCDECLAGARKVALIRQLMEEK